MGLLQYFEGLNGDTVIQRKYHRDMCVCKCVYVYIYVCIYIYIYANIGALHCIPCIHYIYEYLTYILYNTYII